MWWCADSASFGLPGRYLATCCCCLKTICPACSAVSVYVWNCVVVQIQPSLAFLLGVSDDFARVLYNIFSGANRSSRRWRCCAFSWQLSATSPSSIALKARYTERQALRKPCLSAGAPGARGAASPPGPALPHRQGHAARPGAPSLSGPFCSIQGLFVPYDHPVHP